jgi:hypothetical protein
MGTTRTTSNGFSLVLLRQYTREWLAGQTVFGREFAIYLDKNEICQLVSVYRQKF